MNSIATSEALRQGVQDQAGNLGVAFVAVPPDMTIVFPAKMLFRPCNRHDRCYAGTSQVQQNTDD